MKTTCFTLLFAMSISLAMAQVITQEVKASEIYVWSILGKATYLEDGLKMAQPLDVGKKLTTGSAIWVSDNGQVILLLNGTSTVLRGGTHSLEDMLTTPDGKIASGFTNGVSPSPAPSGKSSGRGDEGSGFSNGVTPSPAPSGKTSGRGDEGSGFGQGVAPAPAPSGRTSGRGDEGSGFGQGVAPAPAPSGQPSRQRDAGSGFGQGENGTSPAPAPSGQPSRPSDGGSGFGQGSDGVSPAPAPSGQPSRPSDGGSGFGQGSDGVSPAPAPSGQPSRPSDGGSGFGQRSDGVSPAPAPSGKQTGRSDKGTGFGDGTARENDQIDRAQGHDVVTTVKFIRQYNGNVTPGPVHYEWTQPGDRQICQFQVYEESKKNQPIYQMTTGRSGVTIDLRDLHLKSGQSYMASVRLTGGVADAGDAIEFTLVDPSYQLEAFEQAEMNPLYASASVAHRALLNAMELERKGLLTAATAHFQKAYELDPNSELIRAMIRTFKANYGLSK